MNTKRMFAVLALVALTLGAVAMAQGVGRMDRSRLGDRDGARMGDRMLGAGGGLGERMFARAEWVARYLELTEAQIEQFQAIREQARTDAQTLWESRRVNQEQLHALLEARNPDPLAVGTLVIANHQVGTQLRAIHDNAQAKFVLLLTPDQKVKYDRMLELWESMPRGPGRGNGRGRGPGGFGGGN